MAVFDDICPVDKNQHCSRHNIKHLGRHFKLSQEKSIIGHSYRKQWDAEFVGEINFKDVCSVDPISGVCQRHNIKHEGQSAEWSQDETLIGWRCRKQWDKLASAPPEPEKKDCGCGKPKGKLK